MIHNNYNKLTLVEKDFVDGMFSRKVFKQAEELFGHRLAGDDSVEKAVEAVATWVIESRP